MRILRRYCGNSFSTFDNCYQQLTDLLRQKKGLMAKRMRVKAAQNGEAGAKTGKFCGDSAVPSNEELICTFMEPKPAPPDFSLGQGVRSHLGFWITSGRPHREWGWYPFLEERWTPYMREFLGLLHEVEAKLSAEQWDSYCASFAMQNCKYPTDDSSHEETVAWDKEHLHASAEQKIQALGEVLSPWRGGRSAKIRSK